MSNKKYILGTANLGQKYGINNNSEYNYEDSETIFKYALSNGIDSLDTSPEYGLAHKLIAQNMRNNKEIKITSKISAKIQLTPNEVLESFTNSLAELQINHIDSILFHNPDSFLSPKFEDIVKALLESGKVNYIGVSVYNKKQILQSLEKSNLLTKFQVPENILDRRLISDPEMQTLHTQGINFEVRSIFLQGLILTPPSLINSKFEKISEQLLELNRYAIEISSNLVAICLSYADKIIWNDGTIISAANILQLDEILSEQVIDLDFSNLPSLPDEYLDPRTWNFN